MARNHYHTIKSFIITKIRTITGWQSHSGIYATRQRYTLVYKELSRLKSKVPNNRLTIEDEVKKRLSNRGNTDSNLSINSSSKIMLFKLAVSIEKQNLIASDEYDDYCESYIEEVAIENVQKRHGRLWWDNLSELKW